MTVSDKNDESLDYLQILLPSDQTWRTKNYLKLVERQKALNAAISKGVESSTSETAENDAYIQGSPAVTPHPMKVPDFENKTEEDEIDDAKLLLTKHKRPHHRPSSLNGTKSDDSLNGKEQTAASYTRLDDNSSISSILSAPVMTEPNSTIYWNSNDLIQAAKMLTMQTEPTPVSLLTDSEQMRRVFTLIYDVLRYKSVLDEALETTKFYKSYPELKEKKNLVWLLFYDQFKRDFQPRASTLSQNIGGYELSQTDLLLWNKRVKLGATLSKMRIKHKAYDLENLLPAHLQNSRMSIDDAVISGWINYFKSTPEEVFNLLNDVGFSHLPQEKDELSSLTYKLDHLLPRYIHCRPKKREEFVNTPLIADNSIVMQERTFCLGPAIVAQVLNELILCGNVVQTHISSLPTIAYLANLLATNENVDQLLVFGAGERKKQCEEYLRGLGVNNTTVYSENFSQLSSNTNNILENVIGVLATPPNTNSDVFDPVDLAVSRGGDLSLLEQLTSDTLHDVSGTGQVMAEVLNEQRDTLRVAMSKPQIQFVVYETHSRYDLENSNMVVRVITEMNGYATEKHMEEIKRSHISADEAAQQQQDGEEIMGSIGQITSAASQQSPTQRQQSTDTDEPPVAKSPSVTVPSCDLFELAALPDLCPQLDECLDTGEQGTFIAVIKRKEITRLDPKYMIQMAESRGLFGRKGESGRSRTSREMRKKAAMKLQRSQSGSDADRKDRAKVKIELNRIAAPTHSSNLRDKRQSLSSVEDILCKRHVHHLSSLDGSSNEEIIEVNYPKKWWQELSNYILTWGLYYDTNLPRLKLTRPRKYPVIIKRKTKKVRPPFPIHVNYIEFSSDESDTECIQICPCLILSPNSNSLYTGFS